SSDSVEVRRSATLELGRIGNKRAAPTLIKLLDDADEQVRVNATMALAWMQEKEAVPALIGKVKDKNIRIKSRALQALGQIGDPSAIPFILENINDPDPFVSENAIISAGWLKATGAVPSLMKIIESGNPSVGEERLQMYAAIRALGHIGDKSIAPKLEELAASTNDFPRTRMSGMVDPIPNLYATPQGYGLRRYSEQPLKDIEAGGKKTLGISQPSYLANKDRFFALQKNFNAFAGRAESIIKAPGFNESGITTLPHLLEAGFTGVHNAWGSQDSTPESYFKMVKTAGEFGLHWIDVLPINTFPYRSPFYTDNRQNGVEKTGADFVLDAMHDMPAFIGFWSEETYPEIKANATDFEAWLLDNYGTEYRKKLGLNADEPLPANVGEFNDIRITIVHPLKTPVLEFGAFWIKKYWQETQDWLTSRRKGCVYTYSISGLHYASYIGLTGPVGDIITSNGPEDYQSFGRDNAFFMEMYKDGKARPVMSEFYNMYTPSTSQEIRGFAQHLMHGECFYNFKLSHIFKYPNDDNWIWDNTRWDSARTIFNKAQKIKEYIAVPESAANVAQICSEASACHFDEKSPIGGRWYQNQAAMWVALQQAHIPADVIWAETINPERLSKYNVLVLADAKSLTEAQSSLLKEWVKSGGTLVVTGSTSLFDNMPSVRKNYMLADLFGVDYLGFTGVKD
ncbi:MAG: hypothetical protein GX811_13395, partial [Lentisphaerae bacterium]|nr:hypothetical protein [Lentisphaerota bacterium]